MNIEHLVFDAIDRSELRPYEGLHLAFTGKVQKVVSPTKDQKFVCLQNLRLAELDNTTLFDDRPQVKIQHMWLDVSDCLHMKHQMYQEVAGVALVKPYTRNCGSKAYGLVFERRVWTETSYRKTILELLNAINVSRNSMAERADAVNRVIALANEIVSDGTVALFYSTTEQELKLIEAYRSRFMLAGGCTVTLNREGMRSLGKPRHQKTKQVAKRGFA